MDPRTLSIHDFTYQLPEEKIAYRPLDSRDSSKLLVYRNGHITDSHYSHIADHLPAGSLLVFNNTKVIEARLFFRKPTGGVVEVFCLEPHEQYADITAAMSQQGKVWWKCMVGGASKWKRGQVLEKEIGFPGFQARLEARYMEKRSDHFVIELSWQPAAMSFAEMLHHAGAVPLPPYIRREADTADTERYQTIYAQWEGSVAAPTAGLHFTDRIFEQLGLKDISAAFVTLHVGAGTFKPVKAAVMSEHAMHAEFIDISLATLEQLAAAVGKRPVIPVGTTSLRTLESLYWLGVKLHEKMDTEENGLLCLDQWEVYDLPKQDLSPAAALNALIQHVQHQKQDRLLARTRIIIAPGYHPRLVQGLVTNFHQPQSTLLLLVAALIGEQWKDVYEHALHHDYRFLSYGDGCFLSW